MSGSGSPCVGCGRVDGRHLLGCKAAAGIGADIRARLQTALGAVTATSPGQPQPTPAVDNRAVLDSCDGPHRFSHQPGGTAPRTMQCARCGGWADPYWVGGYELGRAHERRQLVGDGQSGGGASVEPLR